MRFWVVTALFLLTLNSACFIVDTAVSDLPNCEDGILNNNEREIDCGGPKCNPCPAKMNALVNGTTWRLSGNSLTSQVNGNNIFISGMDSISQTISIIHSGSFAPGSYPLGSALFSNLNKTYTSNIGSLHITEWDSTERFLSGFFSFKAFSGPSDSVMVTDGFFAFSPY